MVERQPRRCKRWHFRYNHGFWLDQWHLLGITSKAKVQNWPYRWANVLLYVSHREKNGEHEAHRTGIALYLAVTNTGSAASSIGNISIGYHWHIQPFSFAWLKYSVGWFWLHDQIASLTDFHGNIGENIKVFPFLTQKNHLAPVDAKTYLQAGQSTNGVVYFEQSDSWGGCFPFPRKSGVPIKVVIEDAFGKKHCAKFKIPSVSMECARKYNPSFGKTLAELHGEQLPFDASI